VGKLWIRGGLLLVLHVSASLSHDHTGASPVSTACVHVSQLSSSCHRLVTCEACARKLPLVKIAGKPTKLHQHVHSLCSTVTAAAAAAVLSVHVRATQGVCLGNVVIQKLSEALKGSCDLHAEVKGS
jgi:hypothetical protein